MNLFRKQFSGQRNFFSIGSSQAHTSIKDKLPLSAIFTCAYKFTCSCGSSYIDRTEQRLFSRISEYFPIWFIKGERRSLRITTTCQTSLLNVSDDRDGYSQCISVQRSHLFHLYLEYPGGIVTVFVILFIVFLPSG